MIDDEPALRRACRQAGIDSVDAKIIRAAENTLFRLPAGIVARVSREGQVEAARKEVQVSRWLAGAGLAVVEALPDIDQPVTVAGRAVTFWKELPEHREGSVAEVAEILRRLHRLSPPADFDLPLLAPFVRLGERIDAAVTLSEVDRHWLREHLHALRQQYQRLPPGLPRAAVHGDAWGGNIVHTATGPVLLDLERFAFGPPEWDLASIAVDHVTFGCLSDAEWAAFCERYGYDVTTWPGYETLRDIRELRKVTFAAQMALKFPRVQQQALLRMACIRGEHGPRPWHWQAVA